MAVEARHSPPLHRPGDVTARPRGILKNPSFSNSQGASSPEKEDTPQPPSAPLDPQGAKEITLQNTLQNAGHRRSSSAAGRRLSASRRHSSVAGQGISSDEQAEQQRLKWDEANLYLAEQEAGGRMKITEPKTPFEYGKNAMEEDDDEEEAEVAIDPRFVSVDEVDLAKKGSASHRKGNRESEIPGLELGEAEDDTAGADIENDRVTKSGSLSRENSKDKHVNLSEGGEPRLNEHVGMPTIEEQEKHAQFEERRKKHYEMRNVKDMLGHPENMDDDDDEDVAPDQPLPHRNVNGA